MQNAGCMPFLVLKLRSCIGLKIGHVLRTPQPIAEECMLYMNYSNCSMELANLVESELGIGFNEVQTVWSPDSGVY